MRAALVFPILVCIPAAAEAQSVLHAFAGTSPADQLGWSVGPAGDANADGFADVAAGAPLDDNNGSASGSVRVVSGKDGSMLHEFSGDSIGDELGWWVDTPGDVDGDGHDDLVAGAIFDDDNGTDCGMVRVWSGMTGQVLYTFYGDTVNDNLGGCVTGAGDVNLDGFPDIIGGMDRHDLGGTDAGSARVYSGKDGSVLYTFAGDSPQDNFGFAVDGAGDVNQDGFADLVAGAYRDDNNGADSGSVRIHSGANGATLHTFFGAAAGDQLGFSVAGCGDVDGDGHEDVIAGAPQDDNLAQNCGNARVFSGNSGAVLHSIDGDALGDNLGYSVAGRGDVNGDGFSDFAAGAWQDDAAGGNAGAIEVHSGRDGSLLFAVTGQAPNDRLGRAVALAGDVDQDAQVDVIGGAFLADVGGLSSGAAAVWSGCDSQAQPFGLGCAGSGGFVPELRLLGCANTGGKVTLSVTKALGGSTALLLMGLGAGNLPMGGGCSLFTVPLVPGAVTLPLGGSGAGNGSIAADTTVPAQLPTPLSFTLQVIVVDAGVPKGHANSNGVGVVIAH